jgi:hypothetical protein
VSAENCRVREFYNIFRQRAFFNIFLSFQTLHEDFLHVLQDLGPLEPILVTAESCWNLSLRHRRRASIRLAGYYRYSDTWAFVTENLLTFYSHVDRIVEYINHIITMLVVHQLALSQ